MPNPEPKLPDDVARILWDLATSEPAIADREGVNRCGHCRANVDQDEHAPECLTVRAQEACERYGVEISPE